MNEVDVVTVCADPAGLVALIGSRAMLEPRVELVPGRRVVFTALAPALGRRGRGPGAGPMTIDVVAEVRVDRPREVAAYVTDPANDPHWIGGLRTARRWRRLLRGLAPVCTDGQAQRPA